MIYVKIDCSLRLFQTQQVFKFKNIIQIVTEQRRISLFPPYTFTSSSCTVGLYYTWNIIRDVNP